MEEDLNTRLLGFKAQAFDILRNIQNLQNNLNNLNQIIAQTEQAIAAKPKEENDSPGA